MISQDEATAMERAENQALITSQDACFNNFFFFFRKTDENHDHCIPAGVP